jgi:hypothetical protein
MKTKKELKALESVRFGWHERGFSLVRIEIIAEVAASWTST